MIIVVKNVLQRWVFIYVFGKIRFFNSIFCGQEGLLNFFFFLKVFQLFKEEVLDFVVVQLLRSYFYISKQIFIYNRVRNFKFSFLYLERSYENKGVRVGERVKWDENDYIDYIYYINGKSC